MHFNKIIKLVVMAFALSISLLSTQVSLAKGIVPIHSKALFENAITTSGFTNEQKKILHETFDLFSAEKSNGLNVDIKLLPLPLKSGWSYLRQFNIASADIEQHQQTLALPDLSPTNYLMVVEKLTTPSKNEPVQVNANGYKKELSSFKKRYIRQLKKWEKDINKNALESDVILDFFLRFNLAKKQLTTPNREQLRQLFIACAEIETFLNLVSYTEQDKQYKYYLFLQKKHSKEIGLPLWQYNYLTQRYLQSDTTYPAMFFSYQYIGGITMEHRGHLFFSQKSLVNLLQSISNNGGHNLIAEALGSQLKSMKKKAAQYIRKQELLVSRERLTTVHNEALAERERLTTVHNEALAERERLTTVHNEALAEGEYINSLSNVMDDTMLIMKNIKKTTKANQDITPLIAKVKELKSKAVALKQEADNKGMQFDKFNQLYRVYIDGLNEWVN